MEFITEKVGPTPKLKKPVLIEGLPGVGNVARIVVDYLILKTKAKKIFNIYSSYFPNTVFLTEDKLIEMPKAEVYYTKHKKQDLILVIGDVQPGDEKGHTGRGTCRDAAAYAPGLAWQCTTTKKCH